jgi:hypothetical protein
MAWRHLVNRSFNHLALSDAVSEAFQVRTASENRNIAPQYRSYIVRYNFTHRKLNKYLSAYDVLSQRGADIDADEKLDFSYICKAAMLSTIKTRLISSHCTAQWHRFHYR